MPRGSRPRAAKDVQPIVTSLEVDGPLTKIAGFVAGRVSVIMDHNGNMNLSMRVPAEAKRDAIAVTNFPGVEMMFVVYVPSELVSGAS